MNQLQVANVLRCAFPDSGILPCVGVARDLVSKPLEGKRKT